MSEDEEIKKLNEELEKLIKEMEQPANGNQPPEGEVITDNSLALQRERELDRETAKFTANALDRASTSLVTAGVFAPLAGVLFHANAMTVMGNTELGATVIGCLVGAFVLHWVARGFLEMGFR